MRNSAYEILRKETVYRKGLNHIELAVVEIPCYPAKYYAGLIRYGLPAHTDTWYYHRDLNEADKALDGLVDHARKLK
jgi:hypothetical protein